MSEILNRKNKGDILMKRREFISSSALALAPMPFSSLGADPYPNRSIRTFVGFPPGNSSDVVARIVTDEMRKSMGQTFIIDNRPGASGTLAAEATARSTPDGYSMLVSSAGPLCVAPSMYPKLGYDPLKDFIPITLTNTIPLALVVSATSPIKTFAEFLESAKSTGPALAYASSGNGITNHLVMEMLKSAAKLNVTHIPYKGSAAAVTDLIGGSIPAMFDTTPALLPLIRGGKIRPLAVTSAKRLAELPGIPTIAESGFPGFEGIAWNVILVPQGTPSAIVDRLHAEASKALLTPEARAGFQNLGLVPNPTPLGETQAWLRTETEKWGRIVREGRIAPG